MANMNEPVPQQPIDPGPDGPMPEYGTAEWQAYWYPRAIPLAENVIFAAALVVLCLVAIAPVYSDQAMAVLRWLR